MQNRLSRARPWWRVGALATAAVLLAASLAIGSSAGAQTGPPRLECGRSVSYQIVWPATNVTPTPVVFPFDAVAGQDVSFTFIINGPLWYQDYLSAQLYDPSGRTLYGDPSGTYRLTTSGTHSIQVYGIVNPQTAVGGRAVAQRTSMPFTIALRCSPPPATPTPAPTPPPAPTPTPAPESEGEGE